MRIFKLFLYLAVAAAGFFKWAEISAFVMAFAAARGFALSAPQAFYLPLVAVLLYGWLGYLLFARKPQDVAVVREAVQELSGMVKDLSGQVKTLTEQAARSEKVAKGLTVLEQMDVLKHFDATLAQKLPEAVKTVEAVTGAKWPELDGKNVEALASLVAMLVRFSDAVKVMEKVDINPAHIDRMVMLMNAVARVAVDDNGKPRELAAFAKTAGAVSDLLDVLPAVAEKAGKLEVPADVNQRFVQMGKLLDAVYALSRNSNGNNREFGTLMATATHVVQLADALKVTPDYAQMSEVKAKVDQAGAIFTALEKAMKNDNGRERDLGDLRGQLAELAMFFRNAPQGLRQAG